MEADKDKDSRIKINEAEVTGPAIEYMHHILPTGCLRKKEEELILNDYQVIFLANTEDDEEITTKEICQRCEVEDCPFEAQLTGASIN